MASINTLNHRCCFFDTILPDIGEKPLEVGVPISDIVLTKYLSLLVVITCCNPA